VLALVLDHRLRLVGLIGSDEVGTDRGVHDAKPRLDGRRVIGGAILAEKVLEDKDRHIRPDLHLSDEVLANYLPGKNSGRFAIKFWHRSSLTLR